MRYLKTCLLAFLIFLSLYSIGCKSRSKEEKEKILLNAVVLDEQRMTETFDDYSHDYYTGEISLEEFERFDYKEMQNLEEAYMEWLKATGNSDEEAKLGWWVQSSQVRDKLMARHLRRARLYELKVPKYEADWWLGLQELSPQVRAKLFQSRWQKESPEKRTRMKYVRKRLDWKEWKRESFEEKARMEEVRRRLEKSEQ